MISGDAGPLDKYISLHHLKKLLVNVCYESVKYENVIRIVYNIQFYIEYNSQTLQNITPNGILIINTDQDL